MSRLSKLCFISFLLFFSTAALADLLVPIQLTAEQGVGKAVGVVSISQTPYGLLFTPNLQGLTPGIHGFHLHEHPSCADKGMAAGGHLDPAQTKRHFGPYNSKSHLGDLPVLYVADDGSASLPVLAPRLTHLNQIKHHALIIHSGGDNYADVPAPLGGGGARMSCGVIK
jgi:superoxide dismutase, Cu-Zn family